MIFSEQEIVARTFRMSAKVERTESYKNENNFTKHGEVTIYPSMPCTVQRSTRRNTSQTEGPNEIEYDTVLLHSPSYMVKAGDKVTVTYPNGEMAIFYAGEPFYFESHHEVPLIREGDV